MFQQHSTTSYRRPCPLPTLPPHATHQHPCHPPCTRARTDGTQTPPFPDTASELAQCPPAHRSMCSYLQHCVRTATPGQPCNTNTHTPSIPSVNSFPGPYVCIRQPHSQKTQSPHVGQPASHPPNCSLMLFDWHQGRCAGLLLHLTGGSHTQIPGVDSIHRRPQTDMYKRNAW